MVVLDSSVLLLLFRPAGVPTLPNGTKVIHAKERVEYFVDELEQAGSRIIVPTPVLAEVLVRAGHVAALEIVDALSHQAVFRVEPFDTRAAIEVAAIARADLAKPKAQRDQAATYAKLKFDRQIVAIAKVNGASIIYSDDEDLRKIARACDIEVRGLTDLPLPPSKLQLPLALTEPRALKPGEATP